MSVVFDSGATPRSVDHNRIQPIAIYLSHPSLNILGSVLLGALAAIGGILVGRML